MAYAVFNDGATDGREPWVDYEFTDEPFVEDLGEKGPGRTERVELFACPRRHYRWPAGLTEPQRVAWEAFLQARGILRDAFLSEDPRDPVRELVALEPAVGDGARVTFSLPTAEASPDYRWYSKQGTVVGYVNGVAAAVASVDTDARTVTFAVAPGVGATVKATWRELRLVRLAEPPSFQGATKRFGQYELAIEEKLRDRERARQGHIAIAAMGGYHPLAQHNPWGKRHALEDRSCRTARPTHLLCARQLRLPVFPPLREPRPGGATARSPDRA